MPKQLAVIPLLASIFLAACSSTAVESAEESQKTTSAAEQLAPLQKKTEGWHPLFDAKLEPFHQSTDKFNGKQVEMVSNDVIKLAERQMGLDSASSKKEIEQQVNEFASSAPGELNENISKQAKEDSANKGSSMWTLAYVQPISDSYRIEDESRFTYAWNAELEPIDESMGVTVTLFTRTAYWLSTGNNERQLIVIARWISLSTVDPAYSTDTGDYGWHTYSKISNADICPAAEGEPLEPDARTDIEDLEEVLSPDASKYLTSNRFKVDQDKLDKAIEACDA